MTQKPESPIPGGRSLHDGHDFAGAGIVLKRGLELVLRPPHSFVEAIANALRPRGSVDG